MTILKQPHEVGRISSFYRGRNWAPRRHTLPARGYKGKEQNWSLNMNMPESFYRYCTGNSHVDWNLGWCIPRNSTHMLELRVWQGSNLNLHTSIARKEIICLVSNLNFSKLEISKVFADIINYMKYYHQSKISVLCQVHQ